MESASIFQQSLFSPDEKYVAILLGRNEGDEVMRHHLSIIATAKLEQLSLHTTNETILSLLAPDSFKLPIDGLKWVDERTLEVSVAVLPDFSYESIAKWTSKDDKPVIKHRIDVETKQEPSTSFSP